jgi:hypothetical protein
MPHDEHEVAENRWPIDGGMIAGDAGMGRLPRLFRVGSKLVLEIMPSVAATVIGGYLLAQLHFGHSTEPASQPPAAASSKEPTVGEDRATMRQVLKDRREKPEKPAQVRAAAKAAPANVAPAAPARPVASARQATTASIPSRPTVAAATTIPAAAPRPDAEPEVYVPAPPPGLPTAPPRGMDAPTVIVPSMANAAPPPAPGLAIATSAPKVAPISPPAAFPPPGALSEPDHQGPVGVVFSTFSNFVGHAANATGHTVNWVIDLPGKAISAGGRAIGVSPPPPPTRPLS